MKNKATLLALLALCFSILSMAAGFTYTYRTDTPGASDDPREGDDRMRPPTIRVKATTGCARSRRRYRSG